jgi:hypothetical protein
MKMKMKMKMKRWINEMQSAQAAQVVRSAG